MHNEVHSFSYTVRILFFLFFFAKALSPLASKEFLLRQNTEAKFIPAKPEHESIQAKQNGPKWTRTTYPRVISTMLYQMSYGPVMYEW